MPLSERFPGASIDAMYARLNQMGAPVGVQFGKMHTLSNSHMALEASEYARDQGKFHEFHQAVFQAYFTDGKDIGDRSVLLELADAVGLSRDGLNQALDEGTYADRLKTAQREGARYGVTGTPTFIVNNRYKIVGAQPADVFRQAFQKIEKEQAETRG